MVAKINRENVQYETKRKDNCEKCGGTDNLTGVIHMYAPHANSVEHNFYIKEVFKNLERLIYGYGVPIRMIMNISAKEGETKEELEERVRNMKDKIENFSKEYLE